MPTARLCPAHNPILTRGRPPAGSAARTHRPAGQQSTVNHRGRWPIAGLRWIEFHAEPRTADLPDAPEPLPEPALAIWSHNGLLASVFSAAWYRRNTPQHFCCTTKVLRRPSSEARTAWADPGPSGIGINPSPVRSKGRHKLVRQRKRGACLIGTRSNQTDPEGPPPPAHRAASGPARLAGFPGVVVGNAGSPALLTTGRCEGAEARRGALRIGFIHSATLQCDQDREFKRLAP